MAAAAPPNQRWIFGPFSDLVLGCGLGYAVFILFLPWVPVEGGVLAAVGSFATLVIGAPHYGATLLRVYRNREDRRKYAFFTVYLSAFIWLWFVAGLYEIALGSAMITLYLTWSPWHDRGQKYGLAVMFLRRRGIPFSPETKRLLYASFALSHGRGFISLHRGIGLLFERHGVGVFAGTPFEIIHLGTLPSVWSLLFAILGGGYLLFTGSVCLRLRGAASVVDPVPVAALAIGPASAGRRVVRQADRIRRNQRRCTPSPWAFVACDGEASGGGRGPAAGGDALARR